MTWAGDEIARETKVLTRARRRFLREPNSKHLHDVRTAGRRLRSLLEDVATLAPMKRLARFVKRAARSTDTARDAEVSSALLERSLDPAEREAAQPLQSALQKRARTATKSARKRLRRMRPPKI
jgi:CHAD domain-containing protein